MKDTSKEMKEAQFKKEQDLFFAKLDGDPFCLRIHEEVEEFLRDLTLEYPFQEIFECLRRYEFKNRHGDNVLPFPRRGRSGDAAKDIQSAVEDFLKQLEGEFGSRYSESIHDSFKYFTSTTYE